MRDSKGERYFLDDSSVQEEIAKARQAVQAAAGERRELLALAVAGAFFHDLAFGGSLLAHFLGIGNQGR
jgi:hypothetical protein